MLSRSLTVLAFAAALTTPSVAKAASPGRINVDLTGTVVDSASGQPLQAAEVSVAREGAIVGNTSTDAFGRFTIHNLGAGTYTVAVHMIGFRAVSRALTVSDSATAVPPLHVALIAATAQLEAMQVTAAVPVAVDTRSGDQVFKQNDYHGAPTNTTSQILQSSIVGAARAPTGEVHIRGQHAEYTYYIDGVPVPSGISGSLNELFDPEIVNQINFQTGGWDAEYGNKNAAIVNVTTRIPAGGFHVNAGTYGGGYDKSSMTGPAMFNGQDVSASTNAGRWGFFVSGARQFSDMRLEPVVLDTANHQIQNFHNTGTDLFGFSKVQYTAGTHDVLSLEGNLSTTNFAVPFDSTGGNFANDHQRDVNSFLNLGWHHEFGSVQAAEAPAELFGGLFYRHGSLTYTPGTGDIPQFVFFPDMLTPYNLSERRQFNTAGVKFDYTLRPHHDLELKIGNQSSVTTGHEDFVTTAADGTQGPASNSGLRGSDVGTYAQIAYSPIERIEVRTGVRYDAHDAPFAGTQTQWSPRFRLNLYPTSSTTVYGYYGRLFMPTNVEDLRAITSVAQQGVATAPTLPERDNFFEAGLVQRLPFAGTTWKLDGYYKHSSPGIDDNTVPGSAIVTSVNIADVHVKGIESVLEFSPNASWSGYVNAALAHAYGEGPITGGFFPVATPQGFFDLDHDQRLSVVASATYSPNRAFFSGTAIYGSGLTNGVDPADCGCSYGTGLFDFNQGIKVAPSTIYNVSAGYTFVAGGTLVRPQLYVENLFNKEYLLKGAFFSGASVGRPRSIQLRVNVSR